MEMQISQKQTQTLSPQMILSMKILQMGTQELLEHIETVIQENPVLEIIESNDRYDKSHDISEKLNWLETSDLQNQTYYRLDRDADDSISYGATEGQDESLYDYVLFQLQTLNLEAELALCVKLLAECFDRNGWITEDISLLANEFGQPIERMKQALRVVQSLEPAGIGAKDLSECLCIQLRRQTQVNQLALDIAATQLKNLARDRYGLIAQLLGCDQENVRRAANTIRKLNPRPGAAFAAKEHTDYITPDIIVTTFPNRFELALNEHFSPSLKVSPYYVRLLKQSDDEDVKNYLAEKVQQAKWMIKAIDQRRSTLLSCAGIILELQCDFFRKGPGHLVPMSLADVAQRIGVHESTVSRAVKDKYLQCSTGIYPLSHFFIRRLSAAEDGSYSSPDAAKALLKKLISQEDKRKPLSDQKLCEQMASQGCAISRRTVAKYRNELNIPGTTGRKKAE